MENIPVTIRVPENELSIIDSFAIKTGLSRSDVLKKAIFSLAAEIKENMLKESLIKASKKIGNSHLIENKEMSGTLEDGLDE